MLASRPSPSFTVVLVSSIFSTIADASLLGSLFPSYSQSQSSAYPSTSQYQAAPYQTPPSRQNAWPSGYQQGYRQRYSQPNSYRPQMQQYQPQPMSYSPPMQQQHHHRPAHELPYSGGGYAPSTGSGNPSQEDINRWLSSHNTIRAQYTAQPLSWDPSLVAPACARSQSCVFEHTQNNQYGENLAIGQTTIEEVVHGWAYGPEEYTAYTPGVLNHFTEVVWADVTHVGCCMISCDHVAKGSLPQSPVAYWTCEYNPPGNVIGQESQKVHAAPGGAPYSASSYSYRQRRHLPRTMSSTQKHHA